MTHDDPDQEFISKSALKREAESFLELAEKLLQLPKKQLAEIPMEAILRDAIDLARRLDNHNARNRQMRYIARLLREGEYQGIEAALSSFRQQSQLFRKQIALAEQWSRQLLEGDEQLLEEVLTGYPSLDRQQLRQLIRQAKKDREIEKQSSPAGKKLFDCLQQALQDKKGK